MLRELGLDANLGEFNTDELDELGLNAPASYSLGCGDEDEYILSCLTKDEGVALTLSLKLRLLLVALGEALKE